LIYGIEEAVKTAQRGGVGLIVYFRKEGRALGEVTKCTSLLPSDRADVQTWCTIPEKEEETLQTGISKLPR